MKVAEFIRDFVNKFKPVHHPIHIEIEQMTGYPEFYIPEPLQRNSSTFQIKRLKTEYITTDCPELFVGESESTLFGSISSHACFKSKGFQVRDDVRVKVSSKHYFTPDICIVSPEGLFFDIEVDEPYVASTKRPSHFVSFKNGRYTSSDYLRNRVFIENGWVVIRFSEEQVVLQSGACADFVFQLYEKILDADLSSITPIESLYRKKWTRNEAVEMAHKDYRYSYIDGPVFTTDAKHSKISLISVSESNALFKLHFQGVEYVSKIHPSWNINRVKHGYEIGKFNFEMSENTHFVRESQSQGIGQKGWYTLQHFPLAEDTHIDNINQYNSLLTKGAIIAYNDDYSISVERHGINVDKNVLLILGQVSNLKSPHIWTLIAIGIVRNTIIHELFTGCFCNRETASIAFDSAMKFKVGKKPIVPDFPK